MHYLVALFRLFQNYNMHTVDGHQRPNKCTSVNQAAISVKCRCQSLLLLRPLCAHQTFIVVAIWHPIEFLLNRGGFAAIDVPDPWPQSEFNLGPPVTIIARIKWYSHPEIYSRRRGDQQPQSTQQSELRMRPVIDRVTILTACWFELRMGYFYTLACALGRCSRIDQTLRVILLICFSNPYNIIIIIRQLITRNCHAAGCT